MDDLRLPVASNLPEYTVSEVSGAVKRSLEDAFGRIRVRGEITELKRHSSGHCYFSLKDDNAKLGAIIWKTTAPRLGLKPENGVEVIATGRLTSYPERSCYQIIVDRMEYAGEGALLVRIEILRKRLAAQGLFDDSRKRLLPMLPFTIGVVTSEQGAVLQDIRTTIARRFPRPILLWPVPVQGDGAASRITAAIRGFDALPGELRPDVLIVARGGGSLEDLMAFNDEEVIRAVSDCSIPVISAVGHETDTTLIDHVSDRRAPTPTAAAELAVPVQSELLDRVQQTAARLSGAMNRFTQEKRLRLAGKVRGVPDLPKVLDASRQRLDDRAERLTLGVQNFLASRQASLADEARMSRSIPMLMEGWHLRSDTAFRRLLFSIPTYLNILHSDLEQSGRLPLPTHLVSTNRNKLRLTASHLGSGIRHLMANARESAAERLPRMSGALISNVMQTARMRLSATAAHLEALSPEAVLRRGYALVFDTDGHPVTSATKLRPGMSVELKLADGTARAAIEGRTSLVQGTLPF